MNWRVNFDMRNTTLVTQLTGISMSDRIDSKWLLRSSISELKSLGLLSLKLNELNDSYEMENLVENLKQMLFQEYKSVFTD